MFAHDGPLLCRVFVGWLGELFPAAAKNRGNESLSGKGDAVAIERTGFRWTDSIWFWSVLFCLTGIVLIWAEAPKLAKRREQLVGRYFARQASGHAVAMPAVAQGQQPPLSEALGGKAVFVPIYLILAGLLGYSTWRLYTEWQVASRSQDTTPAAPGA